MNQFFHNTEIFKTENNQVLAEAIVKSPIWKDCKQRGQKKLWTTKVTYLQEGNILYSSLK